MKPETKDLLQESLFSLIWKTIVILSLYFLLRITLLNSFDNNYWAFELLSIVSILTVLKLFSIYKEIQRNRVGILTDQINKQTKEVQKLRADLFELSDREGLHTKTTLVQLVEEKTQAIIALTEEKNNLIKRL